jgi:hypothetical protein
MTGWSTLNSRSYYHYFYYYTNTHIHKTPTALFDLQAQWVVQHLLGRSRLPPPKQRFAWLEQEKARQQSLGRKPRDYFYMVRVKMVG